MFARRYRPLLLTAVATLVATALSCGTVAGGGTHLTLWGFDWYSVSVHAGCVQITALNQGNTGLPMAPYASCSLDALTPPHVFPRLTHSGSTTRRFYFELTMPLWLLATPLLVWQFRRGRRPKHAPGHCQHCGYDVSTITTPHCPECGSPIAATSPPSP